MHLVHTLLLVPLTSLLITPVLWGSAAEPFAKRLLAHEIYKARQAAGMTNQVPKLVEWQTYRDSKVPRCPEVVSTRCFLLKQLQTALASSAHDALLGSFDQLYQQDSDILKDPSMALIYATMLLKERQFPRALNMLFPIVALDSSVKLSYEWIQNLYNHNEKSEGRVAIKNP